MECWHDKANGDNDRFYEDVRYADKFVEIWKKIATRYKGRKIIWGYELLNESVLRLPVAEGCPDYETLMERAAQAINAIDPEATVIVQPEQWWCTRAFERLRPIKANNVVYAAHIYEPFAVTHQGVHARLGGQKEWDKVTYPGEVNGVKWNKETLRQVLQPVVDFQKAYNAHIVVSEFSCVRWAPVFSARDWLSDMIDLYEENGWDWIYHAYVEWDGWSAELGTDPNNMTKPSEPTDREKLLKGWFAKNERP